MARGARLTQCVPVRILVAVDALGKLKSPELFVAMALSAINLGVCPVEFEFGLRVIEIQCSLLECD